MLSRHIIFVNENLKFNNNKNFEEKKNDERNNKVIENQIISKTNLYIFYRHQLKGYAPLYLRDEENQFNHKTEN